VYRSLLTACILASAAIPAAAQQQHNQQHNPPRMGQGQGTHPGGNGGVPPHTQPQHNPELIHQQEMQWWVHQMQMQQELARQHQAARRKQAANQGDAGTSQPGNAPASKGSKGTQSQGTGEQVVISARN
jgi:hypothetical protein